MSPVTHTPNGLSHVRVSGKAPGPHLSACGYRGSANRRPCHNPPPTRQYPSCREQQNQEDARQHQPRDPYPPREPGRVLSPSEIFVQHLA